MARAFSNTKTIMSFVNSRNVYDITKEISLTSNAYRKKLRSACTSQESQTENFTKFDVQSDLEYEQYVYGLQYHVTPNISSYSYLKNTHLQKLSSLQQLRLTCWTKFLYIQITAIAKCSRGLGPLQLTCHFQWCRVFVNV